MKQTSFRFLKDYKKEFGGSLLIGKRKTRRPLSTKAPIHLILKANQKAVFSPSNRSLQNLIRNTAKQFDIHLYDLAVNWSHIHFLIRIKSREDYVRFIRALSSLLSQAVLKSKKRTAFQNGSQSQVRNSQISKTQGSDKDVFTENSENTAKLFTLRPFTRILSWGMDFKPAFQYLTTNQLEAFGLVWRSKEHPSRLKIAQLEELT